MYRRHSQSVRTCSRHTEETLRQPNFAELPQGRDRVKRLTVLILCQSSFSMTHTEILCSDMTSRGFKKKHKKNMTRKESKSDQSASRGFLLASPWMLRMLSKKCEECLAHLGTICLAPGIGTEHSLHAILMRHRLAPCNADHGAERGASTVEQQSSPIIPNASCMPGKKEKKTIQPECTQKIVPSQISQAHSCML